MHRREMARALQFLESKNEESKMKIVLTGGPSAGKTTIAEVVARTFKMALVPESASILFRGGFPRSESGLGVCFQQVAIHQVQKQLENIVEFRNPGQSLICDRGRLDGLAYWPQEPEAFFQAIGSSLEAELRKYDWVIDLNTANPAFYSTSSLRIESASEAAVINSKIREVWGHHPNYLEIKNSIDFDVKIKKVLRAVSMIHHGYKIESIRDELSREAA
jgi:hypothetical protein